MLKDKEKTMIKLDDKDRQRCQIYTRIMGYFRAVYHADGSTGCNAGKVSEYKERVFYKEKTWLLSKTSVYWRLRASALSSKKLRFYEPV